MISFTKNTVLSSGHATSTSITMGESRQIRVRRPRKGKHWVETMKSSKYADIRGALVP